MKNTERSWIPGTFLFVVLLGSFVARPADLAGQELPDSIRQELEALRARVDSLARIVAQLRAQGAAEEAEDAAARLRAAAEAAAAAGVQVDTSAARPAGAQAAGRQRNLQALNPEITVTGDLLGFAREQEVGENSFIPREFEFSFQAALDPFSRAKIFVAHHIEGGIIAPFLEEEEGEGEGEEEGHGHGLEGETEIEEGYIEWVNLPGGVGLTVGKFRQRLGTYNRWHPHALPWQQMPLPYVTFVGEEGLGQTGVSLYSLLPFAGFGTWELWLQGTRSSNGPMFGESDELSWLGHLNAFWEPSPSTYFELGVSGLTGTFQDEEEEYTNRLYHVEAALSWRPPAQALYRELILRGALMWRDPDLPEGEETAAMGGYAHAEYRFARQWLVGVRGDYVEDPADTEVSAWLFAPTLTWWQSEWVRLRAEYDRLGGDVDSMGQFLVQVTFALGPHKHETY